MPITLNIAGNDDTAAAGDLDSTGPLFIIGNGLENTIIRACNDGGGDCAGIDRIIHNTGANLLFIERVTLRRGTTAGGGAAILNSGGGTVSIHWSDIRNNTAGGGFGVGTGALVAAVFTPHQDSAQGLRSVSNVQAARGWMWICQ